MSRLKLTIRYDGTQYHGWQVQQNAVTVQQVLQDALESILQQRPGVTGCSRTDAGVHANRFCLHFDYDGAVPPENILRGLNARLPDDISAIEIEKVADDFHARYSVKHKRYNYYICNSKTRNPFLEKYSWHINKLLDVEKMNEAAQQFLGTHDFKGFCAVGSSVVDTVRTIYDFTVTNKDDLIVISVCADGFLYNMVRILVGTLYDTESGKIEIQDIPRIIDSKDRSLAGITAPAKGLFLENITY